VLRPVEAAVDDDVAGGMGMGVCVESAVGASLCSIGTWSCSMCIFPFALNGGMGGSVV